MNRFLIISLSVLFISTVLFSCISLQSYAACERDPHFTHGGPVTDYISLVDNLRYGARAKVEPMGPISQPFFTPNGWLIAVNGQSVQSFEFSTANAADTAAKTVSADGSLVGTTHVDWIAAPHFYKICKLIVIYVGDDKGVIRILEEVIGPQFAGR